MLGSMNPAARLQAQRSAGAAPRNAAAAPLRCRVSRGALRVKAASREDDEVKEQSRKFRRNVRASPSFLLLWG